MPPRRKGGKALKAAGRKSESEEDGGGAGSAGEKYSNIGELWEQLGLAETADEKKLEANKAEWYRKDIAYWSSVEASTDGVLGGNGNVTDIDIRGSKAFILSLDSVDFKGRAADIGAGIGRTTQHLLCPLFSSVDLVEPVSKFVEKARTLLAHVPNMGKFVTVGAQDWNPGHVRYALIWIQWVICHLPDDDVVRFLQTCARALGPNGVVCLKENICVGGFSVNTLESNVTRTDEQYRELFAKSGMKLIAWKQQGGLPKIHFPVYMYALRPKA